MKVLAITGATALLLSVAGWAQDSKSQPAQPAAASSQTPNGALPELKTVTYKGTLLDASCAGKQAENCKVSEGTKEFAIQTKDGKTLLFDSVGNLRTEEAIKNKKHWKEIVSNGKPISAKVSAHLEGDKLTVVSIN